MDKAKRNQQRQMRRSEKARSRKGKVVKTSGFNPNFPSYPFWILHGANFLMSNYTEGTWDPLFPQIYAEDYKMLDTPEAAATAVLNTAMQKYGQQETWPLRGTTAVSFAISPMLTSYTFYRQALNAIRLKHPGENALELIRKPCQNEVWKMFEDIMTA